MSPKQQLSDPSAQVEPLVFFSQHEPWPPTAGRVSDETWSSVEPELESLEPVAAPTLSPPHVN